MRTPVSAVLYVFLIIVVLILNHVKQKVIYTKFAGKIKTQVSKFSQFVIYARKFRNDF